MILESVQCAAMWTELQADYGKVFPALLQIAGHNRARQREKLAAIIEDLASIQDEVCMR